MEGVYSFNGADVTDVGSTVLDLFWSCFEPCHPQPQKNTPRPQPPQPKDKTHAHTCGKLAIWTLEFDWRTYLFHWMAGRNSWLGFVVRSPVCSKGLLLDLLQLCESGQIKRFLWVSYIMDCHSNLLLGISSFWASRRAFWRWQANAIGLFFFFCSLS